MLLNSKEIIHPRNEIPVPLRIEYHDCVVQLDTDCAFSLAPLSFVKQVCPGVEIKP